MFSGSYHPDDVTFLLKPVRLEPIGVAEKERLIQSGRRHYSEMISPERLPSDTYLEVFYAALEREKSRFARNVWTLAHGLAERRPGEVTIVSMARAGTPIGVLLGRALRQLGRVAKHYSISIIRDRGIDENALRTILELHPPESIAFVDGWTGKGVIATELRRAIRHFNERANVQLDAGLYTVADLCGAAAFAATFDDYLIPSSVLGATISGLVSRSILNAEVIGPNDYHGCLYYEEFASHDRSRWFVDEVTEEMERQKANPEPVPTPAQSRERAAQARGQSELFLNQVRAQFGVRDPNRVKPGLGEATRVLLRRVPDRLLLRDLHAPQVAHLRLLAEEKRVPIIVDAGLPYAAAALIKELDG